MAALTQIEVKVPPLQRRRYGLDSQITWLTDILGEHSKTLGPRWERLGITYRPTARLGTNTIQTLDPTDPNAVKTATRLPGYQNGASEVCYLWVQESTITGSYEELAAEVTQAFDTQAGLFVEESAYSGGTNGFATGSAATVVPGSTGIQSTWPSIIGSIAELESVWSSSNGDVEPTLHIPFFAYPYVARCAADLFSTIDGKLYTLGGTPVVLGAGYTNLKHDGTAMPAGTISMHMTGPMFGLRSALLKPIDGTENIAPDTNTRNFQIEASFTTGWNSFGSLVAYGAICD